MTAHPKSREFEKPLTEQKQKTFNLALQGGGSHGAFTWGVLDRLLEEDKLILDGITAASAGSINAVVLTHGLSVGGRQGAKQALPLFWRRMSALMASSIVQPSILDKIHGNFGLDYSPGYMLMNMLCQFLSPYQLNPFNLKSAEKLARRNCRLPAYPSADGRQIISLRDQYSNLQGGDISRQRTDRGPRACLFMPTVPDARCRDRR
jgi:predicted acylesterase/phospholipase RssA